MAYVLTMRSLEIIFGGAVDGNRDAGKRGRLELEILAAESTTGQTDYLVRQTDELERARAHQRGGMGMFCGR
jgi:hypothetical protein